MGTALLIIDVQNIMFTEDGGVSEAAAVTHRIAGLLAKARREGIPVIFIQHTEPEGELAAGQPGWEIHPAIAPRPEESVVRKGSWDAFLETDLEEVLAEKGIGKLIICGMQTEFCVDTTVRGAYARGYRDNVVVSDGHTTFDTENISAGQIRAHHNRIWGGRFARLVNAGQVDYTV